MRLDTDRAALSALLSTVDTVTGYPYRPTVIADGDAWPRLPDLAREGGGLVWRPVWTVLVALSSDEQVASAWIDEHFGDLVAAVESTGRAWVDSAAPATLQTSAGDRLVLEITLRSY